LIARTIRITRITSTKKLLGISQYSTAQLMTNFGIPVITVVLKFSENKLSIVPSLTIECKITDDVTKVLRMSFVTLYVNVIKRFSCGQE